MKTTQERERRGHFQRAGRISGASRIKHSESRLARISRARALQRLRIIASLRLEIEALMEFADNLLEHKRHGMAIDVSKADFAVRYLAPGEVSGVRKFMRANGYVLEPNVNQKGEIVGGIRTEPEAPKTFFEIHGVEPDVVLSMAADVLEANGIVPKRKRRKRTQE